MLSLAVGVVVVLLLDGCCKCRCFANYDSNDRAVLPKDLLNFVTGSYYQCVVVAGSQPSLSETVATSGCGNTQ